MFTFGDFEPALQQCPVDVFTRPYVRTPSPESQEAMNMMQQNSKAHWAQVEPLPSNGFMMQTGQQMHVIGGYQQICGLSTTAPIQSTVPTAFAQPSNGFPQRPPGVHVPQMEAQAMPVGAHQQCQQGTVIVDGTAYTATVVPVYNVMSPGSKQNDASSPWTTPMQGNHKQGRVAERKKLVGAVLPEEIAQAKRAVQEKLKAHSQAPEPEKLRRSGCSGSTCSTWDGSSEAEDISESLEEDLPSSMDAADTASNDWVEAALLDLEGSDKHKQQRVCKWVLEAFWPLAFNKRGCRVVQKAMELGPPSYQLQLLKNLPGHVYDALQNAHANYVLQKLIEVVAPERLHFIIKEIHENILYVARHRFGCRIVQRLLEHCTAAQMAQVIDKLLKDAAGLCRHQYGNFVLQHILQYGTPRQRHIIAECIVPDVMRLSKHRLASHIISCALVHCAREDIERITDEVFKDQSKLYQLSRREYGSFVVREANRAVKLLKGEGDKAQCIEDVSAIGSEDGDQCDLWNLD